MADDSTNGTIDQHLEDIGSPGTQRTLRRVRRAHKSRSANPPTGSVMWENANAAITSRHQQQQQQPTREQRTSAAEQELVLTAASLRRSAAARARLNGDTDRSANDDSNGIDDDNTGSNGTFDCCNSLRNAGGHSAIQPVSSDIIDYRFRWKNWSNWFAVPPPTY